MQKSALDIPQLFLDFGRAAASMQYVFDLWNPGIIRGV